MNKIATLLVLTIAVGINFTANAFSDIQGDAAIIGSNVNVDNLASIEANSLTLDAAKEQSTHGETHTTTTVSSSAPTLNENEVTVANLSETNTSTTETTTSTTWSGSSLNAGNLNINTDKAVNIVSRKN